VYNDGYLLKYAWSHMFAKQKQNDTEEAVQVVDEI
jgi:hypothetical protein